MTAIEIMQEVSAGRLTAEAGAAQISALTAPKRRKATIKMGTTGKGNVVVKLGSQVRYPTTLYANQWLELAEIMPDVVAFIEANRSRLSWKDSDEAEAA